MNMKRFYSFLKVLSRPYLRAKQKCSILRVNDKEFYLVLSNDEIECRFKLPLQRTDDLDCSKVDDLFFSFPMRKVLGVMKVLKKEKVSCDVSKLMSCVLHTGKSKLKFIFSYLSSNLSRLSSLNIQFEKDVPLALDDHSFLSDYVIEKDGDPYCSLAMSADDFFDSLLHTYSCIDKRNGALFSATADEAIFVATDGYRLSVVKCKCKCSNCLHTIC